MRYIFRMVLFALLIKAIIQGATLFPNYGLMLQNNRFLIIAFIHLILLGFVSFGFVYISIKEKILPSNKSVYLGLAFWVIGFVITEAITAALGFGYSFLYSFQCLWLFSLVMLVGISFLLYQRFIHRIRLSK